MLHVLCTLHLSPFHALRSLQSFPPLQLVVRTAYRIKRLTRCIYIYILCSSDQSSCLFAPSAGCIFNSLIFKRPFFPPFLLFVYVHVVVVVTLLLAVVFASQVRLPCPILFTQMLYLFCFYQKIFHKKTRRCLMPFFLMYLFPMTRSTKVLLYEKGHTRTENEKMKSSITSSYHLFNLYLI
jgi:hypothetical protein